MVWGCKMAFFKRNQKKLALTCDRQSLERAYHISEDNLKKASQNGDAKWLKTAMKQHGDFEYAMLYQNTPEFKKKLDKRGKRR